jgi:hypothetical protein
MTLADVFAVGHTVTMPDGKGYTLRPPTQVEQAEFQRWLEQRAHDGIERSRGTQEAKDRRHTLIDDKAALGYYEWDGPLGLQSRWTVAGLTKAVEIVCRPQGVDEKLAEEIARQHIRAVSAAILQEAARDPKALAPILGAMGLPMDWFESAPSEPSSSNS